MSNPTSYLTFLSLQFHHSLCSTNIFRKEVSFRNCPKLLEDGQDGDVIRVITSFPGMYIVWKGVDLHQQPHLTSSQPSTRAVRAAQAFMRAIPIACTFRVTSRPGLCPGGSGAGEGEDLLPIYILVPAPPPYRLLNCNSIFPRSQDGILFLTGFFPPPYFYKNPWED
jgi:hypothetical protein